MAATRKAQATAEQRRISQIGDFKKRIGGVIELPSGFIVRWRNPGGLRAFLANGTIPNSLMPLVQKALNSKQGVEESEVVELIQDPEKLQEMMALYDSIAVQLIVEPRIHAVPTWDDVEAHNAKAESEDFKVEVPEDLRYEDKLYVDELPDEDKMFLFQLMTGGTKDLETFRQRHEIGMDSLARVSGVIGHPVDTSGTDKG